MYCAVGKILNQILCLQKVSANQGMLALYYGEGKIYTFT